MMKPEPSELVLRGCRSPPLEPPGPPRRFLKKSSKNSSNGEPGGNCGIAPRSPPAAALGLDGLRGRDVDHRVDHLLGDIGDAVRAARQSRRRQDRRAQARRRGRSRPAGDAGDSSRLESHRSYSDSLLKTGRNFEATVRPNRVRRKHLSRTFRADQRRRIRRKRRRRLTIGVDACGNPFRPCSEPGMRV